MSSQAARLNEELMEMMDGDHRKERLRTSGARLLVAHLRSSIAEEIQTASRLAPAKDP